MTKKASLWELNKRPRRITCVNKSQTCSLIQIFLRIFLNNACPRGQLMISHFKICHHLLEILSFHSAHVKPQHRLKNKLEKKTSEKDASMIFQPKKCIRNPNNLNPERKNQRSPKYLSRSNNINQKKSRIFLNKQKTLRLAHQSTLFHVLYFLLPPFQSWKHCL